MTARQIRFKIRKIMDSLRPKNTAGFGYLDKEIGELQELHDYFDKKVKDKK